MRFVATLPGIFTVSSFMLVLGLSRTVHPVSPVQAAVPLQIASLPVTTAVFQPPSNPRAPLGDTSTTGTRGGSCDEATLPYLLLAPRQQVGQTTSSQPTVSWYTDASIADQEQDFYLYEYDAQEKLQMRLWVTLPPQNGYRTYQIPSEVLNLKTDTVYQWSIEVRCAGGSNTRTLVDSAQLEVKAASPELTASLTQAETPEAQARLYAQAGFWYDTLALVAEGTTPAATHLRQQLLRDLHALEKSEQTEQPEQTEAADFASQLEQLL